MSDSNFSVKKLYEKPVYKSLNKKFQGTGLNPKPEIKEEDLRDNPDEYNEEKKRIKKMKEER